MRKLLSFLVLLPLFSLNKVNYSVKAIKYGITSISLSPLYVKGKSYFAIEINATDFHMFNVEIHLQNDLYKDVTLYTKKSCTNEKIIFEYDNKFTRAKNNILIKQIDLNNDVTKTYIHDLSVSSSVASLIKNDSYTSNKVIYKYTNNAWSETHEFLTFEGFEHLYSPNYYHKIDLNDFKIHLDSDLGKLRYSNAKLLISNRNGVFDNLEHDSIYAHISLNLKEIDNNLYSFEFAKTMYVDKHSLKMFDSYQSKTIKTNHFYFPVNEKRYEEEYDCFIVVDSIGIDDAKVSHAFTIKSQKNIVGDCLNSEFCIVRS